MSLQVLSDPKSIILAPSHKIILERRLVTSAELRRNLRKCKLAGSICTQKFIDNGEIVNRHSYTVSAVQDSSISDIVNH